MKVLITGANGQLGRELCRLLGEKAVPLAREQLDLTRGHEVFEAIVSRRPKVVINCAAYTRVDRAEIEPELCRAVNATAVRHMAVACRELDCTLVQISSDYVFAGGNAGNGDSGGINGNRRPWREDEQPQPQGVYAMSKADGELFASQQEKHLIVRTCGLYARASDMHAVNFVRTMLRLGGEGKRLRVVADQICTPSYVPHVARAVLFLAGCREAEHAASWGIYHITNAGETTWHGFAKEIFRLAGLDIEPEAVSTAEFGDPTPRPSYSVLDTSAYHRLGGPPLPHWQAAMAEYFSE